MWRLRIKVDFGRVPEVEYEDADEDDEQTFEHQPLDSLVERTHPDDRSWHAELVATSR